MREHGYPKERTGDTIIRKVLVGTTHTQLIEGDYSDYELILIANPANTGTVALGRELKESVTFPLLETAYLYVREDLDKLWAVGTNAADVVNIILQKKKVFK